MWFFSEEQKILQKSLRTFSNDALRPFAAAADEKEQMPEGHFQKLANMGLLGITAPEEFGGAGMDCVSATIAMEEISNACASTALSYLAHSILCVHNLVINGSQEQKEKYLPDLISGKKIGGVAISEPNSGTDALSIATSAVKKGNLYLLNGTKMFITNAPQGHVFYTYARTGPERKDLSTFIVEKDFPGFRRGKKLSKMGMRGSPTGELIFENCEVPEENLVNKENTSVRHMMKNLDIERITIAGISLGIGRAALDVAIAYSRERQQFNQPIGNFQMIQKMLADGDAEMAAARALVYDVGKQYDIAVSEGKLLGKAQSHLAARAKLIAAQTATKVSLDAIQVLGGYGYMREFPVERYMRDAKLVEIGAGTNEAMRMIIAREYLNTNK